MQLYARDQSNGCIHARRAVKQFDYTCFECKQIVRLRGGPHRQPHFYHPDPTPFCRQHQKGVVHLNLQAYFFDLLPANDCILEYHFSEINRIADVAWISEKIIFEIQCSPISAEEVLQRNRDYSSLGWTVVWILHDRRYNQIRASAAEIALRSCPHYFSNMNLMGQGTVYDQYDYLQGGIRKNKLSQLVVNAVAVRKIDNKYKDFALNPVLRKRMLEWSLSFEGDLLSLYEKNPEADYFKGILAYASKERSVSGFRDLFALVVFIYAKIVNFYSHFLKYMLERACR